MCLVIHHSRTTSRPMIDNVYVTVNGLKQSRLQNESAERQTRLAVRSRMEDQATWDALRKTLLCEAEHCSPVGDLERRSVHEQSPESR